MASIEIIGIAESTYTRAVLMACQEKGVDYALVTAGPHSPPVDAIHPFGKVPVMRHDDFELCETNAIALYLDRVFPGPKLIPDDARAGALTEQWVSLVNTPMDPTLVRAYLFAYIFPETPGKPDRAKIDAALPALKRQVAVLDRAVAKSGYLAGDGYTFADMNLMPILAYLMQPPESSEAIRNAKNLAAYFERHSARPSFKNTIPPPPPARQSQPN
jgi:glutathione S-transferase